MNKQTTSIFENILFYCRWSFVFCLLIVIAKNSYDYTKELHKIYTYKTTYSLDHNVIGYQFEPLKEILEGVEFVGYYTDTDLSEKNDGKFFAQAQYTLAPTVLEHNNLKYEYIIFACSNENLSYAIINKIGAKAIRRYKNFILAQRSL